MNSYVRMEASRLPSQVGTSSPTGFLTSTGHAGFISYGPYISLEPGNYVAGFYIRRIGVAKSKSIILDVSANGVDIIEKSISHQSLFEDLASFVYVAFKLSDPVARIEFRVRVGDDTLIELRDLVIFNSDQRIWSVA